MNRRLMSPAFALCIAAAACAPAASSDSPASSDEAEQLTGKLSELSSYAPCGTALAEVDGIWAYSNGQYTGTGDSCGGRHPSGSLLYQCVEYAQRYMRAMYGTPEIWPVAVAAQMCYDGYYPAGTRVHWQGSGYRPVRGDLAVWTDNNYGHVAVVKATYDTGIDIVEQNASAEGQRFLEGNPSQGYWTPWGTSPDCFIHADANTSSGEPSGGSPSGGGARCDELGYDGSCFGDVSVWAEGGDCRVRDCGGESKTCGYISADAGYGCLGGTSGASTISCAELGYEGRCFGDTLVWVDNGKCRAVHCPDMGRTCGWDGPNGNNCI